MSYGDGWRQGTYEVKNPAKYMGTQAPVFRSSLELRFFTFLDYNQSVVRWGSELFPIPYMFDIDKSQHQYYPDIYFETDKGRKILVEIKPFSQCQPPKQPKNRNPKALKRYMTESRTFIKNQNKWKYASAFCKAKGIEFKIITEKDF